jgi:hypothetical protein
MPVQCMQMTFYIYVAIDITGHLHVLHWHELPFQEDDT